MASGKLKKTILRLADHFIFPRSSIVFAEPKFKTYINAFAEQYNFYLRGELDAVTIPDLIFENFLRKRTINAELLDRVTSSFFSFALLENSNFFEDAGDLVIDRVFGTAFSYDVIRRLSSDVWADFAYAFLANYVILRDRLVTEESVRAMLMLLDNIGTSQIEVIAEKMKKGFLFVDHLIDNIKFDLRERLLEILASDEKRIEEYQLADVSQDALVSSIFVCLRMETEGRRLSNYHFKAEEEDPHWDDALSCPHVVCRRIDAWGLSDTKRRELFDRILQPHALCKLVRYGIRLELYADILDRIIDPAFFRDSTWLSYPKRIHLLSSFVLQNFEIFLNRFAHSIRVLDELAYTFEAYATGPYRDMPASFLQYIDYFDEKLATLRTELEGRYVPRIIRKCS